MIGIGQLVLIFAIVLLLFGAGKIPSIMKDLGKGMRAFKIGLDGIDDLDSVKNNRGIKISKSSKKKKIKEAEKLK